LLVARNPRPTGAAVRHPCVMPKVDPVETLPPYAIIWY
jgi:hypothetical protein